jgi:hypothetical protein
VSIEAFKWAKTVRDVSPMEQHLLIWIADFYNDDKGFAFPSRKTLSEASCIHVRSITRLSQSLDQRGLIRVQRCIYMHTGHNSSNRYFLPRYDPSSDKANPARTVWLSLDGRRQEDRVHFADVRDDEVGAFATSNVVMEWLAQKGPELRSVEND